MNKETSELAEDIRALEKSAARLRLYLAAREQKRAAPDTPELRRLAHDAERAAARLAERFNQEEK